MAAAFFDSNIVVYAVDPRDDSDGKRSVARELIRERDCVLSTQVLMEVFNVLVRLDLMDAAPAKGYVRRLCMFPIITIERGDVLEALELRDLYQIHHYDGLILRAAAKSGVSMLYTEDLNHGQMYGPVRVCNPFIEDFLA
ncbi:MAG: PIN domain-containing protein [Pseudomonadota bacterium]